MFFINKLHNRHISIFVLVTNSDFIKGITICVVPFIVVDIIKLSLSAIVGKNILKRINLRESIKIS